MTTTDREPPDHLHVMAQHAPVLLWMSGIDALCNYFNQGWLKFTGRTMEQEVGEGWAEGVHPDDRDRCVATYMEAFRTQRPFAMKYRLRRADGAYRWIYDEGGPLYDAGGVFAGYVGAAIDITWHISVAVDLHDSVGQLLAGGRILAQNILADAPEELRPRVQRLVDIFGEVIDEVRGASRSLASGEVVQGSLHAAMAAFAEQARGLFAVSCAVHAAPDADEADPYRKSQAYLVMREAVVNAAKHSGCSRIDVHFERDGAWNVLRVRDDGAGIRPVAGHNGLGLRGMEHRASLLGGELRIEPRAPSGTEVMLRWPASPAADR